MLTQKYTFGNIFFSIFWKIPLFPLSQIWVLKDKSTFLKDIRELSEEEYLKLKNGGHERSIKAPLWTYSFFIFLLLLFSFFFISSLIKDHALKLQDESALIEEMNKNEQLISETKMIKEGQLIQVVDKYKLKTGIVTKTTRDSITFTLPQFNIDETEGLIGSYYLSKNEESYTYVIAKSQINKFVKKSETVKNETGKWKELKIINIHTNNGPFFLILNSIFLSQENIVVFDLQNIGKKSDFVSRELLFPNGNLLTFSKSLINENDIIELKLKLKNPATINNEPDYVDTESFNLFDKISNDYIQFYIKTNYNHKQVISRDKLY